MITILMIMALGSTAAGEGSPVFGMSGEPTTTRSDQPVGQVSKRAFEPRGLLVFSFLDHFSERRAGTRRTRR